MLLWQPWLPVATNPHSTVIYLLHPFLYLQLSQNTVDCVWNVMAHTQKLDFVFRRNGRIRLNRQGRQFSWLLAAEVCASAVVMLDTPCSMLLWRVLASHSIRQFPLHFPSHASPCAITFQLDSYILLSTSMGKVSWCTVNLEGMYLVSYCEMGAGSCTKMHRLKLLYIVKHETQPGSCCQFRLSGETGLML